MKRSIQTTIAAVLNALWCLVNIVMAVPLLALGADAVNEQAAMENPPYFVVVIAIILGVVGLVGSWGLWQNQKWAKIVVIIVDALGGLSALPGILFAETPALRMSAISGVVIPLVIIVLLLWPRPKAVAESAAD
jgi:uncharacterized membrane protein (DUF2068 family)